MGFFSKLFAGTPRPLPAERVPALGPLIGAIATDPRQMWSTFSTSLRGRWDLRMDAASAMVDLYLLKQPAAQRTPLINSLVATDPAAWTMVRALYVLEGAYTARGSGTKVKDQAGFTSHLNAAQVDVVSVLNADPQDPAPCALMVTIAKLTGDDALGAHMHGEGLRRAPDCYALHRALNDKLSARWGGSHQAQLDHARQVSASAPNGSLAAGLPINAIYFHLSHFIQFDDNHSAMMAFAKRPEVMNELRHVTARSVDDPQHPVSAATFDLRTKALLIGGSAGDADFMRRQFAGIGDVFIDNTWRQLNPDPEPLFDMYKQMYGR